MGRGLGEPTLLHCWRRTHMLPCPGERAVENMLLRRCGLRKMVQYGLRSISRLARRSFGRVFRESIIQKCDQYKTPAHQIPGQLLLGGQIWRDRRMVLSEGGRLQAEVACLRFSLRKAPGFLARRPLRAEGWGRNPWMHMYDVQGGHQ